VTLVGVDEIPSRLLRQPIRPGPQLSHAAHGRIYRDPSHRSTDQPSSELQLGVDSVDSLLYPSSPRARRTVQLAASSDNTGHALQTSSSGNNKDTCGNGVPSPGFPARFPTRFIPRSRSVWMCPVSMQHYEQMPP
jgi:hypothetical protein